MKTEELSAEEAYLAWKQEKMVEAAWKPDDGKLGRWGLIYNFKSGVGEYWPVIFNDPKGWHFRLAPEPPTKRYRDWMMEEVPLLALVRRKGFNERAIILGASSASTVWIAGKQITNKVLAEEWEHSLNNGKTWLPCGVEVSE